jgi:hypothetical protein
MPPGRIAFSRNRHASAQFGLLYSNMASGGAAMGLQLDLPGLSGQPRDTQGGVTEASGDSGVVFPASSTFSTRER